MSRHSQGDGLDSLEKKKCVKGRHGCSCVPQKRDPCFERVDDGTQGLGGFQPDRPVITGIRARQEGEPFLVPFPIKGAAINQDPAHGVPVPP